MIGLPPADQEPAPVQSNDCADLIRSIEITRTTGTDSAAFRAPLFLRSSSPYLSLYSVIHGYKLTALKALLKLYSKLIHIQTMIKDGPGKAFQTEWFSEYFLGNGWR